MFSEYRCYDEVFLDQAHGFARERKKKFDERVKSTKRLTNLDNKYRTYTTRVN